MAFQKVCVGRTVSGALFVELHKLKGQEAMEYKKSVGIFEDAKKIRSEVFIKEQGFQNEFDETDKTAAHIVFYDDNNIPYAVCRYFRANDDTFVLGRIAIIKKFRGKHLGNLILQISENEIKQEGGRKIKLSAQLRAKGFYEKNGYKQIGDIYFDEYCEHITMEKVL